MKAREYRDQSEQDLEAQLGDLRRSLFELRSERQMGGKLEKPHQLGVARREIARVMTVIAEKKNGS